jgi:hypothetical protein
MFLSGKFGYVTVGGAQKHFSSWRLPLKTAAPKVTNFLSQGFRELVVGISEATIDIEGPYNSGFVGLASGGEYVFVLGLNADVGLTVTAIITNLEPSNDVEDVPKIKITAESNGPFDLIVL